MVELRHLRYFLAVAEEKHFGRAADRLHMAQPPLSSQIKQLENTLGTLLLERTTRKVELTEAGALLMERARLILAEVEAAKADVAAVGSGAAGILRVGFAGTATYLLMPKIVRVLREALPLVQVQITGELLTPQMEDALLENRLDVAILRPPVQSSEILLQELQQTRLVAVFYQGHRLSKETGAVSVKEFIDEDIVAYPRGSSVAAVSHEMARQAGFRPRIVQEAKETSTLIALISAGLGIGIMPGSQSLPMHSSILTRPLIEDFTVGLSAAWKHGNESPILSSFLELAVAATNNLEREMNINPPNLETL